MRFPHRWRNTNQVTEPYWQRLSRSETTRRIAATSALAECPKTHRTIWLARALDKGRAQGQT